MSEPDESRDALVISYLGMRRAIGAIGVALPFVLAIGHVLAGKAEILHSMSAYYHTEMRNVLVGSMCVIAAFFLSYRGHEGDRLPGLLVCAFALGDAFFPETPPVNATQTDRIIGVLHVVSAAGLILTLAYFALKLFPRTDQPEPSPRKLQRNRVCRACGYVMLVCLAMMLAVKLLPSGSPLHGYSPIFWLEACAILAFAVSWFTKGQAILADVA